MPTGTGELEMHLLGQRLLGTQSLGLLAVTVIYLVLIVPLMLFEEDGLRQASGDDYERCSRGRPRLVRFVYCPTPEVCRD